MTVSLPSRLSPLMKESTFFKSPTVPRAATKIAPVCGQSIPLSAAILDDNVCRVLNIFENPAFSSFDTMSTIGATLFGAQSMTTRMSDSSAANAIENSATDLPSRSRPFRIIGCKGFFVRRYSKSILQTIIISCLRCATPSAESSPNA